jgi:hypothetical protein
MADIFERNRAKPAGGHSPEGSKAPKEQPSITALQAAGEGIRIAITHAYPGLNWEKFRNDVLNELHRLGVQGSAEIAAGLFGESNVFVPYGRGQWPGKPGKDAAQSGMLGDHKEGQEQHHGLSR